MAHGVPARMHDSSHLGQENLASANFCTVKHTPSKMPDFHKMHEDWELKQKERREAARKVTTTPVAFSLSSSNKRRAKKRNSVENRIPAKPPATPVAQTPKPVKQKMPSPLREQVINTAAAVVDMHRAVYEASTPVALPSSVIAPLPPVPEPLPAPSIVPSGSVHVTFASGVGKDEDASAVKSSVVATPFHKRITAQLPPIVATQPTTPKKTVRIVTQEDLDVESQLPAGSAYYSSPCVTPVAGSHDQWPELRAFAPEPTSLHNILNYRPEQDVNTLRRATTLTHSLTPSRFGQQQRPPVDMRAKRASLYYAAMRTGATPMAFLPIANRLQFAPTAIAESVAAEATAYPTTPSKKTPNKAKRVATFYAEELAKLANTPSRKQGYSDATLNLLNCLTPKRARALPLDFGASESCDM